jgi:hypothetical protein
MKATETLNTIDTVENWCGMYPWWIKTKSKIGVRIINPDDGRIIILYSRDPKTLDEFRNWEVLDWVVVR